MEGQQINNNKLSNRFRKKNFTRLLRIKVWSIIIMLSILALLIIGAITSIQISSNKGSSELVGGNKPLSQSVLKWKSSVEKYCKQFGVPQLVPYALAIMEVESGGNLPDLMQSSESAGLPVNTLQYEASIEQGIKHLKNCFDDAKIYKNENDLLGIIQAYNYGKAYITYLGKHKKSHDIDIAEQYSKEVVAPSLGNTGGTTYSYVNEVSMKYNKTYLYTNGGNFFYAYLVQQYVGGGSGVPTNPSEFYSKIKNEMEKYQGWSYVWGGKNPQMGFDCSGLTSYLYQTIVGIPLESYTVTQFEQSAPVSLDEAKSGDLIFFRGTYGSPDFISHVGIYVNKTTMYDSSSRGIGYHTWNQGYWLEHFAGVRRVKK
ncbi:lysozyme family protein [Clostridium botulinum]|uniref:bifunctional lytic transglycosylase/C40 family peptidase n=1 Tax=Clostridium botulinum TaxID=1491 RepID=UPI001C9AD65B|nr:bifunctional lysozyme/C40 family peptidase [Clostridium botulinum]MBY6889359.1 lysozyme family protein [Clostridium botulinum]